MIIFVFFLPNASGLVGAKKLRKRAEKAMLPVLEFSMIWGNQISCNVGNSGSRRNRDSCLAIVLKTCGAPEPRLSTFLVFAVARAAMGPDHSPVKTVGC
jgi:hypothetical protein